MRILTLSNCPLDTAQGSGYVITNYCRGLQARGHDVEMIGPETFEGFFPGRFGKRYRQTIGMLATTFHRMAKEHWDLLEIYGAEGWLTHKLCGPRSRRKWAMVSHSNGLEPFAAEALKSLGAARRQHRWYQADLSRCAATGFRAVDGLVTVSRAERDYAIANRYQPPQRVLGLENPLPDEALRRPFSAERAQRIGFCGSWLERKGIDLLVRDLSAILEHFPACRLRLMGVGSHFRAGDYFPSTLAERVEVFPFVREKPELLDLYSECSVVAMPSIYESFGLVAAEAMACGCALVATRTGFAAALRPDDEAVLLSEPKTPTLFEAVERLLLDEPFRQRVARAGYDRVQGLRWDTAVARLEAFYVQLCRERAEGTPLEVSAMKETPEPFLVPR